MAAAADVPIVRYLPNAKARKTRQRKNNLHDFTIEIRPFGGFCFYTMMPFMHRIDQITPSQCFKRVSAAFFVFLFYRFIRLIINSIPFTL